MLIIPQAVSPVIYREDYPYKIMVRVVVTHSEDPKTKKLFELHGMPGVYAVDCDAPTSALAEKVPLVVVEENLPNQILVNITPELSSDLNWLIFNYLVRWQEKGNIKTAPLQVHRTNGAWSVDFMGERLDWAKNSL